MIDGIDHLAIACYDTRKQIEWYCGVLGMRVIASNNQDPPAVLVGYGEGLRDGAMLELMPVRDMGPKPDLSPRFSPGLRHIALRVPDFGKTLDRLMLAGVKFIGEPGIALGGGRVCSFRDPEGNELQIVER